MTYWPDIQRVRRELNWQRVDRFLTAACNVFIGLAAWYGLLLLGIAAANGRLTP